MVRSAASGRTAIGDWTVQYEADALPEDSTPAWTKTGTFDVEEINPAGYLHIDKDSGSATYNQVASFSSTLCTIEFKVVADDMPNPDVTNSYFSLIMDTDDGYLELAIGASEIALYGDVGSDRYAVDTSVEHTYRGTKAGVHLRAYVDGALVISVTDSDLGSYTPSTTMTLKEAEVTLDYVYFSINGFPRLTASSRSAASGRVAV